MRRRFLPIACAAALVAVVPATGAHADPDETTLEADLEAAVAAVADAQERVETAEARAEELAEQIEQNQAELDSLSADLDEYAVYLHTEGDLRATAALLAADSPDQMIDMMAFTGFLADERAALVAQAEEVLAELEAQREAHADELAEAEQALEDAEEAEADLEAQLEELRAEQAAGPSSDGGAAAATGYGGGDGGCTEDDPTTDGCLTPRTLHMYYETKNAGFDHYVSCYRAGGSGEHPQGRACDWSANASGFQNVPASGADKDYGDRLAAWYVNNASSLGVYYVIWYNQFWSPSSGWRSYSGGDGTPAGDHTNHVHVSMN